LVTLCKKTVRVCIHNIYTIAQALILPLLLEPPIKK
jgi:hypothetical protein